MTSFLLRALAGAAATASGNGLARFAYVPLFPAMVGAGWVDGGEAGTLGAAALLGYLIGTLLGRRMGRALGVPGTLDAGMGLIVLSLAACAWNGGFWWFLVWRTMAGIAGGFLMALAGPATQASVPPARRGAAGGIVISGVGSGIAIGAVAVPALLAGGLAATWLGLAGLVLLLWAFAHPRWPDMAMTGVAAEAPPRARLLLLLYGLHGAGMVPPMVYLADLAARGRGLGVGIGALLWLVFGLAGVAGGVLSGRVVDRLGGRPTLRLWLLIQVVALALALVPGPLLVVPAAATAGFAAVGVTTVTLGVSREMAGPRATGLWVQCTASFAVVQTVVGFALAALFAASGESHAAVFGAGLLFSLAAFGAAVALARQPPVRLAAVQ
ncbi:YbfB/YjiJ family MFS transporter [Paracraurococcus lichenis]|uniref:YbfB/YjiJ family MFS transporter n=1 Tax=Paracraurococcus lichenis TaxID=3064888 RepID=A0ABT9E2D1_9PROT|nr:YbfB/YjiJ family MFS transporter [Paracraurococcus sp. LOR1-02]MDO9710298.1 YbfB/YjiJ family MFS transporter [Paracraurococcus sp. LOR1-02]